MPTPKLPRLPRFLAIALLSLIGCARSQPLPPEFAAVAGERIRILDLYPGVTVTLVAPNQLDARKAVELILYALPNGNTTAETIGRKLKDGISWRYDIQHIGAQTREYRARTGSQAIVAYLEANTKSWPEWRRVHGYDRANRRIVSIIDQIRTAIGSPRELSVILTGHSGGGSFTWGFIDGQDSLPRWLHRIAFLDSNYSFEPRHGERMLQWLRRDPRNTLMVLAYDDREIMLDGRKVVSDSGGTWRATQRMLDYYRPVVSFTEDRLGDFIRFRAPQMEVLLHPNPANRILHTEMIGEMNGYLHALLVGRAGYDDEASVLLPRRLYSQWVGDSLALPAAAPPSIPMRDRNAISGTAFIEAVASLPREQREAAILRELLAGNMPSFLRALRTVEANATDSLGVAHTVAYQVMPDYLAIGSDDDYVRMPMNPYTAQAFCDAFGFVLPTRKIVDDIWKAASVQVEPQPLTVEREAPRTFLQHHRIIEEQLKSSPRGSFVGGIKKDVVVTNRLLERPDRVAIYGWHYRNGRPIQPVYAGHVDWYVDYSHGIRPVSRLMRVDGIVMSFDQIMADPRLVGLISDEGRITALRYSP